jgi:hypothetical protein
MNVPESLLVLILLFLLPAGAFLGFLFRWRAAWARRFRLPFEEMQRPAGWSLQNRAEDLMWEFIWKFMAAQIAGLSLWSSQSAGLIPWGAALAIGMPVVAVFFWLAFRDARAFFNHRLGLRGEQVVGQVLDRLSGDSLRVFHDIQIDQPGHRLGNIDHVVLTRAGVYAIETKARRKPVKAGPDGRQGHKLVFDGSRLIFPDPIGPDTHGLAQARRNANWLQKELSADNGEPIAVHAALVFPGWWVEAKGKGDVTVLNHKQLASYLTGRPQVIPDRQFDALRSQLEKLARIDLGRGT